MTICPHIKAKGAPDFMTLYEHLSLVKSVARRFAGYLGFDISIAVLGAVLHDIGKAHPVFQDRLFNTPLRNYSARAFK